jgi:multidrug resistance efflux pump
MSEKEQSKLERLKNWVRDPVRRVTLIVLGVAFVVFVWYMLADRITPYTTQARVEGLVVPIVPQVSGYVMRLDVRLHSIVDDGDTLLQLDQRPFDIGVQSAQAALDDAFQQMGAQSASVQAAVAGVGVAEATLDRAQRNFNRVEAIQELNPGALSQADRDRAETSLSSAQERLASAQAELTRAQEQLGIEGPGNPRIRSAVAALQRAELDRVFSTLIAPFHGGIENFTIDLGFYAAAGQPVGTFVSTRDVWIQADMRENNIGNMEIGDRVELALDVAPGRIYRGTVRSIGFGVSSGQSGSRGELEQVSQAKGWLRDPQRFAVIIALDEQEAVGYRRVGGQANVVVYTSGNVVLNSIAWLRLRLSSLLSYVR